ncbi:hypothetical protein D3C87_1621680 [compost metagenome]
MAAGRDPHQRIHRQREDVIERQRAKELQLLRARLIEEGGFQPCSHLLLVGEKVGMGEDGALGYAGCSAGILKKSDIMRADVN